MLNWMIYFYFSFSLPFSPSFPCLSEQSVWKPEGKQGWFFAFCKERKPQWHRAGFGVANRNRRNICGIHRRCLKPAQDDNASTQCGDLMTRAQDPAGGWPGHPHRDGWPSAEFDPPVWEVQSWQGQCGAVRLNLSRVRHASTQRRGLLGGCQSPNGCLCGWGSVCRDGRL